MQQYAAVEPCNKKKSLELNLSPDLQNLTTLHAYYPDLLHVLQNGHCAAHMLLHAAASIFFAFCCL